MIILAFLVEGTPRPVPDEFFRDGGVEVPEYRVTYDDRGWRCSCPQWLYRLARSKGKCKHIEQCLPELQRHRNVLRWWQNEIGGQGSSLTADERLELFDS